MADSPFTTVQPIFSLSTTTHHPSCLFPHPRPTPTAIRCTNSSFSIIPDGGQKCACDEPFVKTKRPQVVSWVRFGDDQSERCHHLLFVMLLQVQFRAHNLICKEPQNIHQIKHLLALDRIINPLNLRTESILTSSKQKHNVGEITLTSWICLGRHC